MIDPIRDFCTAMADAGLVTTAAIVPDGQLHRVHFEGDRPGSRNGWYVLHDDAIPAGKFGSWRTGDAVQWRAATPSQSPAEEAARRATIEAERRLRQVDADEQRLRTARKAHRLWRSALPARPDHPYLARRRVLSHGIRQTGDRLVIPVRQSSGAIAGLQYIDANGDKRFLAGSSKRSNYYMIGEPDEVIVIAEGYATAASIHESTGFAVACAFDAGNLRPVAEAVRAAMPGLRIVVGADNDRATPNNPGMAAARDAANAVGGVVVAPTFAEHETGSDWNDVVGLRGRAAVRDQFNAALADPSEERRLANEARNSVHDDSGHDRKVPTSSTAEPRDESEGHDDAILDPRPSQAAFAGPIGEIALSIAPHTEAAPIGILICLLAGFGNIIGRSAHQQIGPVRHGGNLFVALVGSSATGRKARPSRGLERFSG
jgi:putative DNA primase/helicase